MARISIVFKQTNVDAPEHYITNRLASVGLPNPEFALEGQEDFFEDSPADDQKIALSFSNYDLEVGKSIDLSEYTGTKGAYLNKKYLCMQNEVLERYPLLPEEKVLQNTLTYLTRPINDIPAFAVVLNQITTLSECSYIYPDVFVDTENESIINVLETPQIVFAAPHEMMALAAAVDPKEEMAAKLKEHEDNPSKGKDDQEEEGVLDKDYSKEYARVLTSMQQLAGALASAMPLPWNAVGGGLLAVFWPNESGFAMDWDQLAKIVGQELVKERMEVSKLSLMDYRTFLLCEYEVDKPIHKNNTILRRELLEKLQGWDGTLLGAVNTLFYSKLDDERLFKDYKLANFLIAANLHIGHLQEQVILDLTFDNPNPALVAHVISYTMAHMEDLKDLKEELVKNRLSKISSVRQFGRNHYSAHNVTTSYGYEFIDKYPKKKYCSAEMYDKKTEDEVKSKIENERKIYIKNVEEKYRKSLKWLDDIISSWKKITDDPLPSKKLPYAVPDLKDFKKAIAARKEARKTAIYSI